MTTTAAPTARPTSSAGVLALQYANPARMVGVPLAILAAVVVLTVLTTVVALRSGAGLQDPRTNGGVFWGTVGYAVAIGVQGVAASFPFALALGTTRRAFVAGNLLANLLQSLLITVAALLLLGLELATGGWFVGAAALATALLGDGDPLVLAGAVLLGVLAALSIGGVYGAAWMRFGARGPLLTSLGAAVLLLLLALVLLPRAQVLLAAFEPWWAALAAVLLIAVASIGQYLLLRRASVR